MSNFRWEFFVWLPAFREAARVHWSRTRFTGRSSDNRNRRPYVALPFKSISGANRIDDCMLIDQSPISRSPRSAPVTYVKAFDAIRKVFADTVDARTRNYGPGHFSYNSDKGRCEQCEGAGVLEIDMQFLADVSMQCPSCRGSRYRDDVLEIHYRDRSIADVLGMSVREAYSFFRGYEKVQDRLKTDDGCWTRIHSIGSKCDNTFQWRGAAIEAGGLSCLGVP